MSAPATPKPDAHEVGQCGSRENVGSGGGTHSLKRVVRRIGRCVAHACGLLVVTPEKVQEWSKRATEYSRISGDYNISDARLSGLNDGRCQSLNRCCHDVMVLNTPNESSSATPRKDGQE